MTHPERIYTLTEENLDTSTATRDSHGDPVRPHIVFFQEAVPNIEPAIELVEEADVLVIIGTSMAVYPAAGLVNYRRRGIPVYYIDPNPACARRHNCSTYESHRRRARAHTPAAPLTAIPLHRAEIKWIC